MTHLPTEVIIALPNPCRPPPGRGPRRRPPGLGLQVHGPLRWRGHNAPEPSHAFGPRRATGKAEGRRTWGSLVPHAGDCAPC